MRSFVLAFPVWLSACVSFTPLKQSCVGSACEAPAAVAPLILTVTGDSTTVAGRVEAGLLVAGEHLASVSAARLLPSDLRLIIDQAAEQSLRLAFDGRDRSALTALAGTGLSLELTNSAGVTAAPLTLALGETTLPVAASCPTGQLLQGVDANLTCVLPGTDIAATQRTVVIGIETFVPAYTSATLFRAWSHSFGLFRSNNIDQTDHMIAPIPLPEGAVLDEVACLVSDGFSDTGAPTVGTALEFLVFASTDGGIVPCQLPAPFSAAGKQVMTSSSAEWVAGCRHPVNHDISSVDSLDYSLQLRTTATASIVVYSCHARYTIQSLLP